MVWYGWGEVWLGKASEGVALKGGSEQEEVRFLLRLQLTDPK